MSTTGVFIAYSHKDRKFADELSKHLAPLVRQNLIVTSYDDRFLPGSDWEAQINKYIDEANIILLLISENFLASSRLAYSVAVIEALNRQEAGGVRVIPVVLRPVSWRGTPFDKLQALPTGGKPITSWADPEVAFLNIAQGVRKAVAELTENTPQSQNPILEAGDTAETADRAKKMKYLEGLQDDLRRSYLYMDDYENLIRFSSDPQEKQRAKRSIANRSVRTRETLREYMGLANEIGITVPEDIIQASARLEDISNTENVT